MEKPFSLFYKVLATDFNKINADISLGLSEFDTPLAPLPLISDISVFQPYQRGNRKTEHKKAIGECFNNKTMLKNANR